MIVGSGNSYNHPTKAQIINYLLDKKFLPYHAETRETLIEMRFNELRKLWSIVKGKYQFEKFGFYG